MDLTRTTRSPARWLRPALLLSALTLSVACGSGPTSPPPPPPTGVISIAPSAGSGIIEQGGRAAITVLVTRAGSFTGAVTLTVEGLPTGVTAAQSNVTGRGWSRDEENMSITVQHQKRSPDIREPLQCT